MISSRSEVDATAGLLEGRGAGVRRFMALQRSSRAPACTRLSHTRRSYRPMKPTRSRARASSLLLPLLLLACFLSSWRQKPEVPAGRPHCMSRLQKHVPIPSPFHPPRRFSINKMYLHACWIVSGWHLTHPCCLLAPTPQSITHTRPFCRNNGVMFNSNAAPRPNVVPRGLAPLHLPWCWKPLRPQSLAGRLAAFVAAGGVHASGGSVAEGVGFEL